MCTSGMQDVNGHERSENYMNLNVCHLARGRGGQLVSLHAQGVHGLPACKPLELCFHQVGLEAGEVQRR